MDPILISAMRRRISKGYGDTEVRIISSAGAPMAGTTIRGFVEEYDAAIGDAYERGYEDARQICEDRVWP